MVSDICRNADIPTDRDSYRRNSLPANRWSADSTEVTGSPTARPAALPLPSPNPWRLTLLP
jgi:hypothetical protein